MQTEVTSREQVRGRGWSIVVETDVTSREQVRGRGWSIETVAENRLGGDGRH